jgi:hypothetical protein
VVVRRPAALDLTTRISGDEGRMTNGNIIRLLAAGRLPNREDALHALRFAADKSASQLVRAVRAGLLRSCVANSTAAAASLLDATRWVNLKPTPNFLDACPYSWASFTEPQITGGWVHHLKSRSSLARCQALFDAAWRGGGEAAPKLTRIELVVAELGRIDVLVIGEDREERRYCVCIEAKFGHSLTDQLRSYEACLARDHGIEEPNCRALLLIAPELRRDIAAQLTRKRNAWSFLSWKQWLIAYDNALGREADDHDFRRFRRTTLHRASMELSN